MSLFCAPQQRSKVVSKVFERKDRKGSYWIDFKDANGKRHRRKVCPDKRVTQEALNATLTKVARREWVGVVEDSKISFGAFAKLWEGRVLPTLRPGTATRWSGILKNHLLPTFKGSLRAIELGAVEKYIAARLEDGASPASANREIAVLKHILRRARAWKDDNGDRYLTRYPLDELKPLKEPSGRVRFLDQDELQSLLIACNQSRSSYLSAFVLVSLNTGCRRGEILSLTRRSIDWIRHTAALITTKNGEARTVYLNDTAMAALNSLPVRIDGRLFPFADHAAVSRAFRRACQRAKIENFKLHDLRHHFASAQTMGGTSTRALQSLLGHKDARMTMRYSHLSDQFLKDAINRINIGAAAPDQTTQTKTG
jgi:integrase